MNWDYIAGFFDGEGYVAISCPRGAGSFRASVAQSGDIGLKVLQEMSIFLLQHGIESKVYKKAFQIPEHTTAYTLVMDKQESILLFMQNLAGRLKVKRVLVQDLIRHRAIFPKFSRANREFVLKEARGY